jgi:hypothetical protein
VKDSGHHIPEPREGVRAATSASDSLILCKIGNSEHQLRNQVETRVSIVRRVPGLVKLSLSVSSKGVLSLYNDLCLNKI